jgi:peptidoglycan/xylan/chitin deacetylase (PgdA/CDA1 family)
MLTLWLKRAGAWALLRSGALRLKRQAFERGRAIVLLYHRVNDEADPFFPALPVRHFSAQLEHLAAHYHVDTAESVLDWLAEGAPGPPRVVITLDDGYHDTLECVLPELERYGLPATLLLSTAPPETGEALWIDHTRGLFKHTRASALELPSLGLARTSLDGEATRLRALAALLARMKRLGPAPIASTLAELGDRLGADVPPSRVLNWDELRRLAAGPFRIGAHTHRHYMLSRLDDGELRAEITTSVRLIEERLGRPVTSFAYPNGEPEDYDERCIPVLRELGIRCAFTASHAFARPGADPYRVPRLSTGEAFLPSFAARLAGLSRGERENLH